MEKLPEFDEEVLDGDAELNTDIKINPDFYIHHALVNAQKALLKEDMRQGFIQYWGFVEHIELLCDAANMLPQNYQEQIDTFKKSEEYISEPDPLKKSVRVANKKLKLIMNEVFRRKTVTGPLKVGLEHL